MIKDKTDFEKVSDFENLYKAYLDSRGGKGFTKSRIKFEISALDGVYQIKRFLETKRYEVDRYNRFKVYEPKERIIEAGSFKDKIVQHSLCDNVLLPILSNEFVYTNYAGQVDKGTLFGDVIKTTRLITFGLILDLNIKRQKTIWNILRENII